jgi:hypothetical protein
MRGAMKLKVRIETQGATYEATHEVIDAESFAGAFAEAWKALEQQTWSRAANVGELMENLNESVLELLDGAQVRLERVTE